MDAMAKLTEDSLRDGSLIHTGGLSASSTGARVRAPEGADRDRRPLARPRRSSAATPCSR